MLDSRRLTGPNLISELPGAVLDFEATDAETIVKRWQGAARRILDALGWSGERTLYRIVKHGASVVLTAPIDALYAATEINERAFEAATESGGFDFEATVARLRETIADEVNPGLLALRAAAHTHAVTFLSDDDHASVGLGTGALTFSVSDIPDPHAIDWSQVHDVPVALVTGTNGKSTTVRMLAAMLRAAGRVPGFSTTDGIVVGDTLVDPGDYSGPGGARTVLRDRRCEVAILETARGGMLRRGLGIAQAQAALVTNVAEDHLGEFGVADLEALTDVKLIVRRAVSAAGRLVLNADDPHLRARDATLDVPIAWFAHAESDVPHSDDQPSAWVGDGQFVLAASGATQTVLPVDEAAATLRGAATYNVSNALGAILVAYQLGLDVGAMARGLRAFRSSPEDNPGRCNVFDLGGAKAIVDFAHNPHGVQAVFELARRLPAERRLVLLGQAGDRDDESIRAMTRYAWEGRPHRVIIKAMTAYLRGRKAGEIPALIEAELRALGAPPHRIAHAATDLDAVRQALQWCEPGDLLLLLIHSQRNDVLELLEHLRRTHWRPGSAVPL